MTSYKCEIEIRDYSNENLTVLSPENSYVLVRLNLGEFAKISQAERIRARLVENNPKYTFLLHIHEIFDKPSYD